MNQKDEESEGTVSGKLLHRTHTRTHMRAHTHLTAVSELPP